MANPVPAPDAPEHGAESLHTAILRLDELVRTLREQCPWDREQTHTSLRRYLLEETYEALEALDARAGGEGEAEDLDRDLCEELGDLLYQVWFQAHLASERGAFSIVDVAQGVRDKLVARHPHVYGDVVAPDADTVRANWDAIKLQEKGRDSVMDGIPQTLPALLRAVKVQKRAAAAGLSRRRRIAGVLPCDGGCAGRASSRAERAHPWGAVAGRGGAGPAHQGRSRGRPAVDDRAGRAPLSHTGTGPSGARIQTPHRRTPRDRTERRPTVRPCRAVHGVDRNPEVRRWVA